MKIILIRMMVSFCMVGKMMARYWLAWTVLFVFSPSFSSRIRRMINGKEIVGRNAYEIVQYFGAIGFRHSTGVWWATRLVRPARILCGGALITPKIFQTACHCVSEWDVSAEYKLNRAVLDTHWEGIKVVYIGVNDEFGEPWSMETVEPLVSENFFIHMKCAQFFRSKTITHDYGWIKVTGNWITPASQVPIEGVRFAPLYKESELARIWKDNMAKKVMCLHLGFGQTQFMVDSPSQFLLHGWAVIMEYEDCSAYNVNGIIGEDIDDYLNFFCSEPFPGHNQFVGEGDSGGPAACNNFYFGVGSFAAHYVKLARYQGERISVSIDGGIVFAPFENAEEYRRKFLQFVDDFPIKPFNDPDRKRTFRPAMHVIDKSWGIMAIPSTKAMCIMVILTSLYE